MKVLAFLLPKKARKQKQQSGREKRHVRRDVVSIAMIHVGSAEHPHIADLVQINATAGNALDGKLP